MNQTDQEMKQEAENLVQSAAAFEKILLADESGEFKKLANELLSFYSLKLERLEADNLEMFHMRAVKLQGLLQALRMLVDLPKKYIDAKQNAETFLKENEAYFEAKT